MASNDEIFEILSRLSPKALCKLAPVSKSFKNLLSENAFMEKQCKNSLMKREQALIIQDDSYVGTRASDVTLSFLPEHRHDNGIPKNSLGFILKKFRILGSSNGLLLCWTVDSNKPRKLVLCNLVTKTWVPVKFPTKELANKNEFMDDFTFILACGNLFGKKSKNFPFDYMILAFVRHIPPGDWHTTTSYDLHIYEDGEWSLKAEFLETGYNDLNFDHHVCFKDGVFFLSKVGICYPNSHRYLPYIVRINIKNASSTIIALPEQELVNITEGYCNFRVFGWDREDGNSWFKSICLVMNWNNVMNIWVLEDPNSMSSSPWKKILSLNLLDLSESKDPFFSWAKGYTILDKKMIFADRKGNVYRCGFEGGNFGELQKICEYHDTIGFGGLRINTYSPTIRPCFKNSSELLTMKFK